MADIYKHSLAEEDLINIWLYTYEKWGEMQADTYLDQLTAGFDLLSNNPQIGKRCDYIRKEYRCFQIKNHIVYYLLNAYQIDIIRILHESMEPRNYLES